MPGLIDAHTHLDALFDLGPYAELALARGNTSTVSELAMMAGAWGLTGCRQFMAAAAASPQRVFFTAPPLVPPFPAWETSAGLDREGFQEILAHPACLGVGETYWPAIIDGEERAAALLPNPRAKGISLWQRIRTGGISRSASLKRKAIARWTRLSSPVPSSPAPSPLISTTGPFSSLDVPEVTSIRFHRSRAMPRQSNPGPRLAVVAGARTPMGPIIALDSMRAPARRRNGPGPCFP